MYKKLTGLLLIVLSFGFLLSCQRNEELLKETRFDIRTGVNISHWLSQSSKRGEERRNYIVQSDFDTIAAAGFDHVRIPVDEVQLWDSVGNKEQEAFELLHNAIDGAMKDSLKVVVDLHIIRSHYFNAEVKPLWTDSTEQDKLVNMWMQLSDELIQYPTNMVAYEILNEAVADDSEDWNKLIKKVVTAIREKEEDRFIVVGSNRWQSAETFPELKVPEKDKYIILSFHFYVPMALTHHMAPWTDIADYTGPVNYPGWIVDTGYYKDMSEETRRAMKEYANGYFMKDSLEKLMKPAIDKAAELNLPLYCGEYGVYPSIPDSIRYRWYKDITGIFNKYNIAYCHWGYKGDFPLVGEGSKPDKKLVRILTAK